MYQVDGTKKKKKSAGKGIKAKMSSATNMAAIKESIVQALDHNEAEDGLYFRNFFLLHEEDQRPFVKASPKDLLVALNELLREGKIKLDYDDLEITFRLTA